MQLAEIGAGRVEWTARAGVLLAIAGVMSLFSSVVASGIDYIEWEKSGELAATTPTWIFAWHVISLLGIGAGSCLMAFALLRRALRN